MILVNKWRAYKMLILLKLTKKLIATKVAIMQEILIESA